MYVSNYYKCEFLAEMRQLIVRIKILKTSLYQEICGGSLIGIEFLDHRITYSLLIDSLGSASIHYRTLPTLIENFDSGFRAVKISEHLIFRTPHVHAYTHDIHIHTRQARITVEDNVCNKYLVHSMQLQTDSQGRSVRVLLECQDEVFPFQSHAQADVKALDFSCSRCLYDHLHFHGG